MASVSGDELAGLLASHARLTRDPLPESRLAFEIDERVVGSVLRDDAHLLAQQVPGLALDDDALSILPVCAPDAPSALAAMAAVLRDAGRAGRWRNERLAVVADDGTVMGQVERACARVLGIRTFAVHMIGATAPDEPPGYWLQRRAMDKDVDPGRLDTLAGGLVAMRGDGTAMEAFMPALLREVHEEAGLEPRQFAAPVHVGTWRSHRQLSDGFMVEDMLVYRSQLKPGARPANRDGEVSEFLRVSRDDLLARITAGELTLAATLAALLSLQHERATPPQSR